MSQKRGAFIVLEGLDRCGKSTQCKAIVDLLQTRGLSATRMHFPDRKTPTGVMIDSYLKSQSELADEVIHLLYSANRWEKRQEIIDTLMSGVSIVCDRYAYSGVAFSSAKGLSVDWCKSPDAGLPRPDVVIQLDMPIAASMERGGFGEERYEKRDFQEKVGRVFAELRDDLWKVVDAQQTPEEVTADIATMLDDVLDSCGNAEIGPLFEGSCAVSPTNMVAVATGASESVTGSESCGAAAGGAVEGEEAFLHAEDNNGDRDM